MNLSAVLAVLDDVHTSGEGYKALCPTHEDKVPSLSVSQGTDQEVLLHCHAGCDFKGIRVKLVERMQSELSKRYVYMDENGEPVGAACRSYDDRGNKKFFQKRFVSGIWESGSSDVLKSTPYNLPHVLTSLDRGKKVFIVEGEKDVDRLIDEGHCATCNVGGVAMGWKDEHSQWLVGARRIYIIADDDEPGIKHAWRTYDSVTKVCTGTKVTVLRSDGFNDVSDHLDGGGSLNDLVESQRENDVEVTSYQDGAGFIFDTPAEVPVVWGIQGKEILWADGQGLVIVAPQGVGKTSLAALLCEGLLGLSESVLGFRVRESSGLLYLAMDRPYQIASAMRRVFEVHGRESLTEKNFKVWVGPPEMDLGKHPEHLGEMAESSGAQTIIVDSLKDGVLRLTDEAVAQGWNTAVQLCLRAGIQVCVLHHPTKHTGRDVDKPIDLSDVYGSGWITAGMGSVVSLWGSVGSSFFELTQLKSPSILIDPLIVRRNDRTGSMEVMGGSHDWTWFFTEPHTIVDLCQEMYGKENSRGNLEKARRQVQDLVGRGIIIKHSEKPRSNGRPSAMYVLRSPDM